LLKNPDWNHDVIPELIEGKNIADFVDPDILDRLEELEREEVRLEAEGFYDDDDDGGGIVDSDEEAIRTTAQRIRSRKATVQMNNIAKNRLQNVPVVPRTVRKRTVAEMAKELKQAGHDPSRIEERAKMIAQARNVQSKRKRAAEEEEGGMDVELDGSDGPEWEDEGGMDVDVDGDVMGSARKRGKANSGSIVPRGKRVPTSDRTRSGIRDVEVRVPIVPRLWSGLGPGAGGLFYFWGGVSDSVFKQQGKKAERLTHFDRRPRNMYGKGGEADRAIKTKMPKHLFSGASAMSGLAVPFPPPPSSLVLGVFGLPDTGVVRQEKDGQDESQIDEFRKCLPSPLFFLFPFALCSLSLASPVQC
jgi:nucleolar GTP-binding protein